MLLLHAGTSLEHLAKCKLSSIHPVLVREVREKVVFDLLLHATGNEKLAEPLDAMRTVSLGGALERCARFVRGLVPLRDDLQPVIDVRNGVAHLAVLHGEHVEKLVTGFMRATNLVLESLGQRPHDFWGDFGDMVSARLHESGEAAAVRAQEAIASAKRTFDERYGSMPEEQRSVVIHAIEATYQPEKYEEQVVDCPACFSAALSSGYTSVNWEADWDRGDFGEMYVAGVYPVVTFFPGHVACRVCDLELDGDDEVIAAGIEMSWELDDVDPADFYEDL